MHCLFAHPWQRPIEAFSCDVVQCWDGCVAPQSFLLKMEDSILFNIVHWLLVGEYFVYIARCSATQHIISYCKICVRLDVFVKNAHIIKSIVALFSATFCFFFVLVSLRCDMIFINFDTKLRLFFGLQRSVFFFLFFLWAIVAICDIDNCLIMQNWGSFLFATLLFFLFFFVSHRCLIDTVKRIHMVRMQK